MPYKRKRTYKRKPRVSKAVKKYVKRVNSNAGETKYVITNLNAIGPDNLAAIATKAYDIAGGTDQNNRIGNKIEPTSLQIRWSAYRGLTDCMLRLIVFRWTGTSTTTNINLGLVLEQGALGSVNYINAPYLQEKQSRKSFQILHDSTYLLDDAKQNGIKRITNIKVSKSIYYDTALAGGFMKNGIQYAWITDTSPANTPLVQATVIQRYKDI